MHPVIRARTLIRLVIDGGQIVLLPPGNFQEQLADSEPSSA